MEVWQYLEILRKLVRCLCGLVMLLKFSHVLDIALAIKDPWAEPEVDWSGELENTPGWIDLPDDANPTRCMTPETR